VRVLSGHDECVGTYGIDIFVHNAFLAYITVDIQTGGEGQL
jgi:hypothetical protein